VKPLSSPLCGGVSNTRYVYPDDRRILDEKFAIR